MLRKVASALSATSRLDRPCRREPDARGRLEQGALELFAERGYDRTTVTSIAIRAGVTKRTLFRHFPDKREVLFGGSAIFEQHFLDGLATVPAAAAPMEAMAVTLDAVAIAMNLRHEVVRRRQPVIGAAAELQERELHKLASVAATLAGALRARSRGAVCVDRGGDGPLPSRCSRWASSNERRDLPELISAGGPTSSFGLTHRVAGQ